jgi:hypothetical protein
MMAATAITAIISKIIMMAVKKLKPIMGMGVIKDVPPASAKTAITVNANAISVTINVGINI